MKTCSLCLDSTKLIKAHIVPESFYEPLRARGTPREFSTEPGAFPKKRPIGVYDKTILCAHCDNFMGRWDGYAAELLCKPLESFGSVEDLKAQQFFCLERVDYVKLKLFFVSLIWRAHLSTQPFFEQVNLGPFAGVARKMILDEDPGEPNTFGVSMVRYEDPLAEATMNLAEVIRFEGIKCYRLNIPNYAILVKVDRRPYPADRLGFLLTPDTPFFIGLFEYRGSRLFENALEFFRSRSLLQ